MQDPESPHPEQIDWSKLSSPLLWMGPQPPWEALDRDKLHKIFLVQLDFRIDVMRRTIEQMEKIRDIIAEK